MKAGYSRLVSLSITILLLSTLVTLVVVPSPEWAGATPTPSLLRDDFTHDTSLNTSLWQINGPVGSVFGPDDAGVNQIQLAPTFSPAGMTIAQINGSQEYGTIESIADFTPPFTVTADVEGIVSNGHTFGLAISTQNASGGVLVYGNVNPTNCSNLGNCGNPNTCGNSANSNVPPNQCYYGLDAKVGQGGKWSQVPKLYLTPSANVTYTLQISVDAAGNAQYSASRGGQVLGQGTAQVGAGPFYIIMEQVEGSPVAHPGPNEAIWMSVVLNAGTSSLSTTSTSTGPTPTTSGIPWNVWLVIAVIVVLFLILLLLWYSRRRDLIVTTQNSQATVPIPEALVLTEGPEKLSAYTEKDGKTTFKSVKKGDYTIHARAKGYADSLPVKVTVKKKRTELTIGLDPIVSGAEETAGSIAPAEGPSSGVAVTQAKGTETLPPPTSLPTERPPTRVAEPKQEGPIPTVTQPQPATPPPDQQGLDEMEGMGGGRISEIIRTFQAKGAISPETAMTAEELGLSRLFVRIMKRRKGRTRVFIEINGRYYLNQKALQETKRRPQALTKLRSGPQALSYRIVKRSNIWPTPPSSSQQ